MRVLVLTSILGLMLLPEVHPPVPDVHPGPGEVNPHVATVEPSSVAAETHPTPTSVYKQLGAIACYNFDDQTGTDLCGDRDLTEMNSPTYMGGAKGYATDFESDSSQKANLAEASAADFESADGKSFAFILWLRPESLAGDYYMGKDGTGVAGNYSVRTDAGGAIYCRLIDGTSTKTDGLAGGDILVVGTRAVIGCRYNATTNEIEVIKNDHGSGSPASTDDDGADQGDDFSVGGVDAAGTHGDGVVGPAMFWASASGGEVLSDAMLASLYNSGKGKTCADLTAAEQVNLVSCWDMDEDGGPYVDSIGSNDLTAVNTPARINGLVERSDSGMGAFSQNVGSKYWVNSTGTNNPNDEYTVCAWMVPDQVNHFSPIRVDLGQSIMIVAYSGGATPYAVVKGYNTSDGWVSTGGYNGTWDKRAWNFVCGTRTNTEVRVYVNGVQHTTPGTFSTPIRSTFSGAFQVGVAESGVVHTGHFDDVALFHYILPPEAMLQIYNAGEGLYY